MAENGNRSKASMEWPTRAGPRSIADLQTLASQPALNRLAWGEDGGGVQAHLRSSCKCLDPQPHHSVSSVANKEFVSILRACSVHASLHGSKINARVSSRSGSTDLEQNFERIQDPGTGQLTGMPAQSLPRQK